VKHLASPQISLLHSSGVWGLAHLARVISIANQKGGVGKTTTAVNLGASLAASEKRTLIVDSDPQGNATSALGFPKDPARRTLYQALILAEPIERIIIDAQIDSLDLIPSDKNLVGAAVELVSMENREYKLKSILQGMRHKYDFILIDCPPSLDLLTLNALAASDAVLVPIQCEYLALEGVSELLDTLMRLRRTINPSLAIEGILLTMYDDRTTLSKQVAADLRSFFGAQVFESVIPRNVRLAEAPSHGMPVIFYDIHSKGAESYINLAKEVIVNAQKRVGQGTERVDSGTGTAAAAAAGSGSDISGSSAVSRSNSADSSSDGGGDGSSGGAGAPSGG
jgi:chromosome partitioning protein